MVLDGRRLLVTAGPTRVPIDAVRFISNVSSGGTGLRIAQTAAAAQAHVTLLMGPGTVPVSEGPRLRLVRFVTFADLQQAVRSHVGSREYDAVIHAAAVSDYELAATNPGKISSEEAELVLRLRPTPKIVDEIRTLDPQITLVKFKLEAGRTVEELLEIARRSGERSDADLVVANDLASITDTAHPAWILRRGDVVAEAGTSAELAEQLCDILAEHWRGTPLRSQREGAATSLPGRRMV